LEGVAMTRHSYIPVALRFRTIGIVKLIGRCSYDSPLFLSLFFWFDEVKFVSADVITGLERELHTFFEGKKNFFFNFSKKKLLLEKIVPTLLFFPI
jgi:hypothetical protein